MSDRVGRVKELKTIDDHFDLFFKLIACIQELPQGEQTDIMIDSIIEMSVSVVESAHKMIDFIVKQSEKYHKKPSLKERWQDWKERRRAKKQEKAEYKEFLDWKTAQESQDEEEETEPEEATQCAQSNLPVCQPPTSTEVVEGTTDGTEGRQEE